MGDDAQTRGQPLRPETSGSSPLGKFLAATFDHLVCVLVVAFDYGAPTLRRWGERDGYSSGRCLKKAAHCRSDAA
jgi:hypothetical protein